jgi:peptidoglycan/LPS O-acetylase OafA/YrhL
VTTAFALLKLKNGDIPYLLRLSVFFFSGGCFYIYRDIIRINGRFAALFLPPLVVGLFSWRGAELALASFGAYIVLYLAQKHSKLLNQFNRLPDVSYGIYLYGWPSQKLLIWYIPTISPWTLFVTASLISVFLGYLSWHMVEKPMLKFKKATPSVIETSSAPQNTGT